MARPLKSVTRPPVVADEAYIKGFLKERSEIRLFKGAKLTGKSEAERQYLLGMFELFKMNLQCKVDPKAKVYGGYRYKPQQLFDNIMKYFEVSIACGQPLTQGGICAFNGIDKKQLNPSGLEKLDPAYLFLRDCIDFIEFYMEFSGQKKQNPAFQIFWLKNKGWVDKIEVQTSTTQGALTEEERAAAQKRIADFSETK